MKTNQFFLRPPKPFHGRAGQALVLGSFFVVAFFAFAAVSVDVSRLYLEKKKLQNATDSAALAGAIEFPQANSSDLRYDTKARNFATANRLQDAEIDTVEAGHWDTNTTSFTAGATPVDSVRVAATRTVSLTFAPVIGLKTLTVHAHSVAQAYASDSVTGLAMPWVIMYDTNNPPNKCDNFELRADTTPTGGTWRLPSDSNSGSEYRDRIENGFDGTISVGDTIQLVPGLKNGPTQQGVNYRIGLDPNATCATAKNDSGRIVVVPYILPGTMPSGNGAEMTVMGFASFFLTSTDHGAVQGKFLGLFAGKSVFRHPPSPSTVNTALLVE